MHETKLTIGKATTKRPRNVAWQEVVINDKDFTFKQYFNDLVSSSTRNLYFLVQCYDARQSWLDNNAGRNITGLLIDASYSFSYESDLTRSFSFSFYADGTEQLFISPRNVCKFYIGVETEQHLGEIIYYCLGAGVIDSPSWSYDAVSNTVSFSAIDLSCLIDGSRSGMLSNTNTWQYDQDTSVKMNIKGMIDYEVNTNLGYKIEYSDTSISDCIDTNGKIFAIQNDITSNVGDSAMSMLKQILNESLPYYCFYFDSNGAFNYSIWPTADVNRYTQYTIPKNVVISEQESQNYSNKYNYVEVWGLTQAIKGMNIDSIREEGYAGPLLCDGDSYEHPTSKKTFITSKEYNETTNTTDIKCVCDLMPCIQRNTDDEAGIEYVGDVSWGCNTIDLRDCSEDIRINVNGITDSSGNLVWYNLFGEYYPGDTNVIYFDRDPVDTISPEATASEYKYFFTGCGRLQPYGVAKKEDGPFGINNIGTVRYVITNNSLDTETLCRIHAEWELYKGTQFEKTIQINTIPLYFIQAGHLVQYTSLRTGETDTYIVNSVSCNSNINSGMNITMTKFYEYYEEV